MDTEFDHQNRLPKSLRHATIHPSAGYPVWFRLILLILPLLGLLNSALAQGALEVNQTFVNLGSFAAENPSSSVHNPGVSSFRLRSTEPWSLMATLLQPLRRTSDNLELPTERARQIFADLPTAFFEYQPARLDYGPGSGEWQQLDYDWQTLQLRLEQYLEWGDPPGLYQSSLRFELQDRDGVTLADPVEVTIEFEVLPQIEIELIEEGPTLVIEGFDEPAESQPFIVLIRANSAWELDICGLSDLFSESDEEHIRLSELEYYLWAGPEWESLVLDYTALEASPMLSARGDAPAPFEVVEIALPIQLRLEVSRTTVATNYSCDLRLDARIQFPAR